MKLEMSIEHSLLEKCLKEVIDTGNNEIKGVFVFPQDFPAFEGHFPGQPVLPAVVQLAAARLLAAKHLGIQLVPISVDRAKFKAMIGPDEQMTITITPDRTSNKITIPFAIATDKGIASTGKIVCKMRNK